MRRLKQLILPLRLGNVTDDRRLREVVEAQLILRHPGEPKDFARLKGGQNGRP